MRVHSNDYSVDPSAIGRLVQVTADLGTVTVTVILGAVVLTRHEHRWARHQIFTDQAFGITHRRRSARTDPNNAGTAMAANAGQDIEYYSRVLRTQRTGP